MCTPRTIRIFFSISTLFLIAPGACGQTADSAERKKTWEINGYLKELPSLTYSRGQSKTMVNNLIHNRVNLRWNPGLHFTGGAEFRTRLFWGDDVSATPGFSSRIRNPNEAVDLSLIWFESENAIMQTYIDRLWLEYHDAKWVARLGRQRINWGISTIWNPNDIFNTYNFLDFDYEERPGRDAIKIRRNVNDMSYLELAAIAADEPAKTVAAARYFTNRWNYDLQFSGGIFHEKLTLGTGWSGSIQNAGFKGEIQYFSPKNDTAAQTNVSMEVEYMFKNGWYINTGFLYNSNGTLEPIQNWNLSDLRFSPQFLMPTRWSSAVTFSKSITPLLSANLTAIYTPGTNLLIVLPSARYDLGSNLDLDLWWQSFYAEQGNGIEEIVRRIYMRLKWNF